MNHIRKIIRELIQEITLSDHFNERLFDRLKNITEIDFPKELRQEFNKNIKENEPKLNHYSQYILKNIKEEVYSKINYLKTLQTRHDNLLKIYVIAKVSIKYKGTEYNPTLISTDESKLY